MLTALIVEDSRYFRKFLCSVLREAAKDVLIAEAGDGDQLMLTIDVFHPRVVFVDIQLPGVNGLQLTQQIKAVYPDIFVVVMTSHGDPEYSDAAYRAGADRFFRKDDLDVGTISALMSGIMVH